MEKKSVFLRQWDRNQRPLAVGNSANQRENGKVVEIGSKFSFTEGRPTDWPLVSMLPIAETVPTPRVMNSHCKQNEQIQRK